MRLWDGKMGKFVATLRGHVVAVYRLVWSGDSRLWSGRVRIPPFSSPLSFGSCRGIYLYGNLKTCKLETDLPGNTYEVYCVDFVVGKVASGGRDRGLKMWGLIGFSFRSLGFELTLLL